MTILKYYRRRGIILLLYALTLILILSSSSVFGWIPRLTTRYSGFHNSSTRRILLSLASNKSNDNDMPDKSDEPSSSGDTPSNNNEYNKEDRLPLFSSEVDHQASILKLEAIFNFNDIDTNTKDKSTSLINSKDRVVLDSWMDWTAADDNSVPCEGDSCGDGDEFDVSKDTA